jgi:hypothetical protein
LICRGFRDWQRQTRLHKSFYPGLSRVFCRDSARDFQSKESSILIRLKAQPFFDSNAIEQARWPAFMRIAV